MKKNKQYKAFALLSGGLDSLLAIKVIQEQNIHVCGVTFETPFFGAVHAKKAAADLGIDIIILDISVDHLQMLKNPPHGYGKTMNPCIDCHAMMFQKAGQLLEKEGFDFLITGEVLGERPMSQNRQSLTIVSRDSEYEDLLLRPLSAKLLPITLPEKEGWVDRGQLLAFEGRSRKPQIELAKKYGIRQYVQPAGGCLLTDIQFSKRLKDTFEHNPNADSRDMDLLRYGRYFRLTSGTKVLVGRNEKENEKLICLGRLKGAIIQPTVYPGPVVFLEAPFNESDIDIAATMCATYGKIGPTHWPLSFEYNNQKKQLNAQPSVRSDFTKFQLI